MSADAGALAVEFGSLFGRPPLVVASAPGRVNLIGEHTDYNGGYVLPAAIDRTVAVAAATAGRGCFRVRALDPGEVDEFSAVSLERLPPGDWRNYVRGVAWAMREAGLDVAPTTMAITGDVPQGAGLSSSAAIEVAVAGALAAASGLEVDRRQLALLAQRAENGFAGVQCGIMDQFAAALSEDGCALFIDCRSLDTETVPLPSGDDIAIVVVDSKVARRLSETAYNRRREECAEAAAALGVDSLRDVTASALEAGRDRMPDAVYRRARHIVTENSRVLAAVDALRRGAVPALGSLMLESHASLRRDFEVSCPELDLLVELAGRADGVLGARLTGAGFGGCTVNLVRREGLAAFERDVLTEYEKQTGLAPEMHVCRPVEGLRVSHV